MLMCAASRYGKNPRPAKYRVHDYSADEIGVDFGHYGFDSSLGVTSIAVNAFRNLSPDPGSFLMLVSCLPSA